MTGLQRVASALGQKTHRCKPGTLDPAPWTIVEFARDCAEIIEKYCEQPVVLAGQPAAE